MNTIYFGYINGVVECSTNAAIFDHILGYGENSRFNHVPYWLYLDRYWFPNLVSDPMDSSKTKFEQPQVLTKLSKPSNYTTVLGEINFFEGRRV